MPPVLTLHVLPPSRPCMTARAALRFKGLEFEEVALAAGAYVEEMQRICRPGRSRPAGSLRASP